MLAPRKQISSSGNIVFDRSGFHWISEYSQVQSSEISLLDTVLGQHN